MIQERLINGAFWAIFTSSVLMEIPKFTDFIGIDSVNKVVQVFVLIVTSCLYLIRQFKKTFPRGIVIKGKRYLDSSDD